MSPAHRAHDFPSGHCHSIDAFAVGVGFSAMRVQIFPTVLLIGATTFVCSLTAVFVGKRFGNWLGDKAQILGGVILILIGIKSLFLKGGFL